MFIAQVELQQKHWIRQELAKGTMTSKQIFRDLNAIAFRADADWHAIGLKSLKMGNKSENVNQLRPQDPKEAKIVCFFGTPTPQVY